MATSRRWPTPSRKARERHARTTWRRHDAIRSHVCHADLEETIMTEPVISVVGGTGAQGGGVVDALLAARKFKVRVASRNPSSDAAKALTARGVAVVKADLLEPSSLTAFYDGAHGAFLVTNFGDPPQIGRLEQIGATAENAARSAGPTHPPWPTPP